MNRRAKIISILFVIILFLLSLFAGKGLFKYAFYSTHDGLHHLARSFDVIETIKEGHFPLRWAGSLNYGCGIPIYNFFYPLYYYLIIVVNFLVNNVLLTLKIISLFSLVVGTVFFYFWMREETKSSGASLIGSILYLFAPYRFSLIFVRGSPEFLAYAILPIVLYLYAKCFSEAGKKGFALWLLLATLTGGILTISHNFTVMFLMPIVLLYLLIKIFITSMTTWKKRILILLSYFSTFGLGAFFIFPAVFEQHFTRIGSGGSVGDYKYHFPALWQLFRSGWDYFYSAIGTKDDGMSFMLGYAHWLVLGLVFFWLVYQLVFKRKVFLASIKNNLLLIFFFVLSVGSIFLMLEQSMVIWKLIPILKQIQFPWRILGISVFTISALAGLWFEKIKGRPFYWLVLIGVSFLAIYGNKNHMLPMPVLDKDVSLFRDFDNLHPHRYSTTTWADDVISADAINACSLTTPLITAKKGQTVQYSLVERKNTSGLVKFNLVNTQKDNKLVMALGYFPGAYSLKINGTEREYDSCQGLVCFGTENINKGENIVSWKIKQTPIETVFNWVSLIFFLVWIFAYLLFRFKTKTKINRKKIIVFLTLILILALFSFFRFSNLSHRLGFAWDQERDAFAAGAILSGKLTLIGPRVLGPEGFFLPPYFFYLLAPFYFLSGMHPSAMIVFLVVYGLVFFLLSYFLISKMFNSRIGLVFVFLWSFFPLAISSDSTVWNPVLIPLFVLTLFFCLCRFARTKNNFDLFLSGLVLGLGTSFHIQFALLSPILLPYLLAQKSSSFKEKIMNKFTLLSGVLIPFLPLLIFDLRHRFMNLSLLINFLPKERWGLPSAFLPVGDNFVAGFVALKPNRLMSIVFFVFIAAILVGIYRTKDAIHKKLILGIILVWLTFPIFFAFYGKRPSEYYFIYLLPIIFLSLSLGLDWLIKRLGKKSFYFLPVAVIIFFSLVKISFSQLQSKPGALYYKDRVVIFLADLTKKARPFNVSFNVPLVDDSGFRYLLGYYKVGYSGNAKDTLIQIVKPPDFQLDTFFLGDYGIRVPASWLKESRENIK